MGQRAAKDWALKYPRLPNIRAIVSWADDVHHEGTIYRAANFTELGKSGGRAAWRGAAPEWRQRQAQSRLSAPQDAVYACGGSGPDVQESGWVAVKARRRGIASSIAMLVPAAMIKAQELFGLLRVRPRFTST